jgi:outer membrane lipoprotein SlyB
MAQIPILSGIATDENSDFRTAYPVNKEPIPSDQGISAGYLRPASGVASWGTGQGVGRAGINWNDVCYRVMGTKLVSIDSNGNDTTLADVGGSGQSHMDYSFDRLSIQSSGNLFYWDGSTLTQVTDPDLGTVIKHIWVDGYFMTTDGEFLVVTELDDPTDVNPIKYGSSEIDPDPVLSVLKLRNEPHAVNRYTIEVFRNNPNATATEFPFLRIEGGQITRGAVGTWACCTFDGEAIAFVGGGRGESVSVYLGANGASGRIATREIDQVLETLTDTQLSQIVCETRVGEGMKRLYIHLPDQTLVYDANASAILKKPVWFTLKDGIEPQTAYSARNMTRCYGKWIVDNLTTSDFGYLAENDGDRWGAQVKWEFSVPIIYNEGRKGIIHEMELVVLSGRAALGENPTVWTSESSDGETWGQEIYSGAGVQGNRNKRIRFLRCGLIDNMRFQRFQGLSNDRLSIARLEARLEALAW